MSDAGDTAVSGDEPPPDHAARARPSDDLLGRSLALVRFLRDGCPWDARQTPESLRPYLLEEAHETAEAVLAGDDGELAGELGDLLLNVAFQIVLAEERGAFGVPEVVGRLESKMEARHPHVYGDAEQPPDWEEMKARERTAAPDASTESEGSPAGGGDSGVEAAGAGSAGRPGPGPDPLSRALRSQQRAAAHGFAWPSMDEALAKLREEVDEAEALLEERGAGGAGGTSAAEAGGTVPDAALEAEIGDVLLAAVSVARLASVHPMRALERATRTFERRFRAFRRRAEERGLDLDDAPLEELEALWREVKGEEGDGAPEGA